MQFWVQAVLSLQRHLACSLRRSIDRRSRQQRVGRRRRLRRRCCAPESSGAATFTAPTTASAAALALTAASSSPEATCTTEIVNPNPRAGSHSWADTGQVCFSLSLTAGPSTRPPAWLQRACEPPVTGLVDAAGDGGLQVS